MNTLIKWPGGKSNEIHKFKHLIPKFGRYIEPFFGGGALFFDLSPKYAAINDISSSLMEFYSLIKNQDKVLCSILLSYNNSFSNLQSVCENKYDELLQIYTLYKEQRINVDDVEKELNSFIFSIEDSIIAGFSEPIVLNKDDFINSLKKNTLDKIIRTVKNDNKKPFSSQDLKNNILTGFTSGYYLYFRDVFNSINLNKINTPSIQYRAANFYFIREYCYGSMFRYNSKGEFNIPYGGLTYNHKNFKIKIDNIFNDKIKQMFLNTDIHCSDFEYFLEHINLTSNDFIFLDPPYDTDFSDYEGKDFTKYDQERLAHLLKKVPSNFILIIKNTDFIYNLYSNSFNIISFDNKYAYNVRSRNERNVEHLIITNLPVI